MKRYTENMYIIFSIQNQRRMFILMQKNFKLASSISYQRKKKYKLDDNIITVKITNQEIKYIKYHCQINMLSEFYTWKN